MVADHGGTAFANDPLNLLAVDGPTNLRKGDGDAATWLPPRKADRCAYVARQIAVKHRYGLWVTAAERDAMVRVLTACPGQALPKAGAIALGGGREQAAPTPASPPRPSLHLGRHRPAVRHLPRGQRGRLRPLPKGRRPEYDWYQDRDHDGLACER